METSSTSDSPVKPATGLDGSPTCFGTFCGYTEDVLWNARKAGTLYSKGLFCKAISQLVEECYISSAINPAICRVSHVQILNVVWESSLQINGNEGIVRDEQCLALDIYHKMLENCIRDCHL